MVDYVKLIEQGDSTLQAREDLLKEQLALLETKKKNFADYKIKLNDRTTIQELRSKGYSNRAIARELNCSLSTVGYELKRGTVSVYTGNVNRYK
ncbi:helix-turn-helix domain-containing protein, partial [Lactobacillus delbrueckii]